MRKPFVLLLAGMLGVFASGPGAAQGYFFGGGYADDQPPAGGDCAAIAAQIGPAATWYGEFAGNHYDDFAESNSPFSARGCFKSKEACRSWQGAQVGYAGRGGIVYTRCTPGAPHS